MFLRKGVVTESFCLQNAARARNQRLKCKRYAVKQRSERARTRDRVKLCMSQALFLFLTLGLLPPPP